MHAVQPVDRDRIRNPLQTHGLGCARLWIVLINDEYGGHFVVKTPLGARCRNCRWCIYRQKRFAILPRAFRIALHGDYARVAVSVSRDVCQQH